MRSTGEVMGIDMDYSKAYAKAAIAAGQKLPTGGSVFITVMDNHKDAMIPIAKDLQVRGSGACMAFLQNILSQWEAVEVF